MANQGQQLFEAWLSENQDAITDAMVDALEHVEGVAETLTDAHAAGWEATRQRVLGLITGAHAVFPDKVREGFDARFGHEGFASALASQAETIAREDIAGYIDILLERYGLQRPGNA